VRWLVAGEHLKPLVLAGADHRLMQVIMDSNALTVPCDAPKEPLGTEPQKIVRVLRQVEAQPEGVAVVAVVQLPHLHQREARAKWLN